MRIKTNIPFQTFNDGVCRICSLENAGEKGRLPVMELREKAGRAPFENRRVGVKRFFDAKQENVEIDKVIRIPDAYQVSTQDVCILDGIQYGVYQVQSVPGAIPGAQDLSLKRLEEKY
ncbi:MAG: hypothetical protein NC432_08780 [Roseburia sp.]|nr:hypothetical protein [Roseburia sp.]MCM1097792.1 hypothetical protein [Ruminococcus flavefaciens]